MSEESVKQSPCFLSTRKHLRSFVGRFIYWPTDQGYIHLTRTALRFVGKTSLPVEVALDAVTDISIGHFSRWTTLLRLDYIELRYRAGEGEQTILLTPTESPAWATPKWRTNRICAEWAKLLQAVRASRAEPGAAADPAS